MFTMGQIRNVIFACLNQSTAVQRISKTEAHINKIHDTCLRLDEIDNMLKKECEQINEQLNKKINQWKLDADQIQRGNETKIKEHGNKLTTNYENIVKHRDLIEEQKRLLNQNQDKISVLDSLPCETNVQAKLNLVPHTGEEVRSADITEESDCRLWHSVH